ncbi:MAG: peptidyl-prolyl cis-trans isomerase [Nannocystis sp.]|nr:peptidylprolyl isomerase [Nannocystis sp.]MBA3548170.1 peptidyl-prolyl cis-trans isomerase [Nannocystis sp.]
MYKLHLLRRAAKDPLLHVLILSAALLAAYTWIDREPARATKSAPQIVRITGTQVAWLQQGFFRQWRRAPTQAELRALVADHLKEQLLAREAQALHLDADDGVVRRRLAQKMTRVLEDTMRLDEPNEDELHHFYELHAEQFATASRVSFTHVYLRPDRRKDPAGDAQTLLAALADGTVVATRAGDRTLLATEFIDADQTAVADALGAEFARTLFTLPLDAWQGPIQSRHGLHLVRVTRAVAGHRREFAEARPEVLARWREQRQREGMDRHLAGLMASYDIVVDAGVPSSIGPVVSVMTLTTPLATVTCTNEADAPPAP